MEPYGASRYVDYSDGVPDMVKQFVVYFYRHIRCLWKCTAVVTRPAPTLTSLKLGYKCSASILSVVAHDRWWTPALLVVSSMLGWWVPRERNIPEIFSMYEVTFAKLSERFFKGTTWPPVEYIAELVDKDSVFCLLYKVPMLRASSSNSASNGL
jgi:hypothetical protein